METDPVNNLELQTAVFQEETEIQNIQSQANHSAARSKTSHNSREGPKTARKWIFGGGARATVRHGLKTRLRAFKRALPESRWIKED